MHTEAKIMISLLFNTHQEYTEYRQLVLHGAGANGLDSDSDSISVLSTILMLKKTRYIYTLSLTATLRHRYPAWSFDLSNCMHARHDVYQVLGIKIICCITIIHLE